MISAICRRLLRFLVSKFPILASKGLATVILLLLLLLTLLGTVDQVNLGLYETQKKYFQSFYVVSWLFDTVPIVLPGVYLLLVLLTVNLFVGGLITVRRRWNRLGIFLCHLGVIYLLVGGFLTDRLAEEGNLQLYEGEISEECVNPKRWEVAISPADRIGTVTEHLILEEDFEGLDTDESRTFHSGELPFTVVLSGYFQNCRPMVARGRAARAATARRSVTVGDFLLVERRPAKEAAQNIPGLHVIVRSRGSGKTGSKEIISKESPEALLWGHQAAPLMVTVGVHRFAIDLRKQRARLPFKIRLDKFTFERHPGTDTASLYRSDVTKIEGETEMPFLIAMNEPLRHGTYTIYQSYYGREPSPGTRMYSGFSVVRNPAENQASWATLIICLGLAIHFGWRLYRYLREEAVKGAREPVGRSS